MFRPVHYALVLSSLLPSLAHAGTADPKAKTKEVLSKVYVVEKKYRSMKGPDSTVEIKLGDGKTDELIWVTGYQAVMVGEDGITPMPQEFMCHSNLDFDPRAHQKAMQNAEGGISGRLFTLSQGQLDIHFPPGFGIPMRSTEALSLTTQVLNLNHDNPKAKVRHRVTVEYLRDVEASRPMKALFQKSVYGLVLLDGKDGRFGMSIDDSPSEAHGPGCLAGQNASTHEYNDEFGRKFTGHWVVPPGRQVNRTPVSRLLDLPYDTTAHYIAVHLHPFAESLELYDLTDKKTVFKSKARGFADKIGLDHVDYFESEAGLLLHKDHEYELISVYNNTTKEEHDSMAVMYMYVLDQRFKK